MEPHEIESAVKAVVAAVRERGDAALLEFTARWDRADLTPETLRVPPETIAAAPVDSPFAHAFERAVGRIRRFHEAMKPRSSFVEDDYGVRMGLRWTAVEAAGLYVPGGKASYPSTLAMTAIPAQIAGVRRIAVVSPPGPSGEVSESVLMAAKILGLDEIYRVGGAQAVAALALGTKSVPRVDKIFGPGNAFVAEAKKQLFGEVGIDMLAGPSEVVVYADHTAEPDWVASDLIAQAEHDEATRVTVLASSAAVLRAIESAFERLANAEPRREIILAAWRNGGRAEIAPDADAAARRIDAIAPEHLSIQVAEPWAALARVRNAGAIFLGRFSPVAVGDYYAGPNHVLPTGTTARFSSCLSVEDFMKRSNVCEMPREFIVERGEDVEILAAGEQLPGHANSVRLRREGSAEVRARPGVRGVTPYLLVEESADVKLNQNESPWDVPNEIKDAVAERLRDVEWNRYHQTLPGELAARIAEDAGVDASSVILGSGSNLILQWIFEAFAEPGDAVVLPEPSFSLYPLWADICSLRRVDVELDAEFRIDADAWVAAIERARPALTVLCLPNNPTGTELPFAAVSRIADAAEAAGSLLVIDEAYREFSDAKFDRTALVRERDGVILVRTFSKAFASAGMRLGYALASPAIARELHKIVPPFHLNLFAAVMGLTVLESRVVFDERVATLVKERERLAVELGRVPGVRVVPSQANFFLAEVESPGEVFAALCSRGVVVRRLSGERLTRFLRVSVGTPEENDRLLSAWTEVQQGKRPISRTSERGAKS